MDGIFQQKKVSKRFKRFKDLFHSFWVSLAISGNHIQRAATLNPVVDLALQDRDVH